MSKLDTPLAPGERRTLDESWYNELVEKLGSRRAPGRLRVTTSSHTAVVHYAGTQPLNPPTIALKDATDWGALNPDRVVLDWKVEGVGHIVGTGGDQEARSGVNSVVEWTWSSETELPGATGYTHRSWAASPDGSPLPTTTYVEVTALILADTVHGPHVNTVSDLNSLNPSTGDRRYVLSENAIYEYDGSDWNSSGTPSWASHDTAQQSIVIERAYDPDYAGDITPRLRPEREAFFLDGGTAVVQVRDESLFAAHVAEVEREIHVAFDDGEENGVFTIDPGQGIDLLSLSQEDRTFEVVAEREGVIRITGTYTLTYDDESTAEHTTIRSVQVWSAGHRRLAASGSPTTPSRIEVTPKNGWCALEIGTPVEITHIVDTQAWVGLEGTGGIKPAHQQPQFELATTLGHRLALDPSVRIASVFDPVPPPVRIAAEIINAVSEGSDESGLRIYEVTFQGRDGASISSARVGEMLYAGGVVLRLTADMSEDDGISRKFRARGYAPTNLLNNEELSLEGHLTGACDIMIAKMSFGYGDSQSEDFPRVSFEHHHTFDPEAGPGKCIVPLPMATPQSVQDSWFVQVELEARWVGGRAARRAFDWQRAEVVPTGTPNLRLEKLDGDIYTAILTGTEDFAFYGDYFWSKDQASLEDHWKDSLPTGGSLSRRTQVVAPAQHFRGTHLTARGHFRARGGTCQPSIVQATSSNVVPSGMPLIELAGKGTPIEAPPSSIVFLKNESGIWASIGQQWVALSGEGVGKSEVVLVDVSISKPEESFLTASRTGINSFEHASTEAESGMFEIRFIFGGGVTQARQVSGPQANAEFNEKEQVLILRSPHSSLRESEKAFAYVVEATSSSGSKTTHTLHLTIQD